MSYLMVAGRSCPLVAEAEAVGRVCPLVGAAGGAAAIFGNLCVNIIVYISFEKLILKQPK
jgi:hypothetical protein